MYCMSYLWMMGNAARGEGDYGTVCVLLSVVKWFCGTGGKVYEWIVRWTVGCVGGGLFLWMRWGVWGVRVGLGEEEGVCTGWRRGVRMVKENLD